MWLRLIHREFAAKWMWQLKSNNYTIWLHGITAIVKDLDAIKKKWWERSFAIVWRKRQDENVMVDLPPVRVSKSLFHSAVSWKKWKRVNIAIISFICVHVERWNLHSPLNNSVVLMRKTELPPMNDRWEIKIKITLRVFTAWVCIVCAAHYEWLIRIFLCDSPFICDLC